MARTRLSGAEVERRRQSVLRYVMEVGEVRIDALTERFGVSLMTMHRDLDELAGRRLVRKLRGRVAAYPALTVETATRFREELRRDCKRALGDAAAAQVADGQTLLLDDSTTLFPLAHRLTGFDRLTVITNSLRVARVLGASAGIEVIMLGGTYKGDFDSCFGPEVLDRITRTDADTVFMSVTALAGGRMYHPVAEYARLKEAMLHSARRRVLLADHSKFGRTATYAHGDTADVDLVITDRGAPRAEIAAIRGRGTEVEVVAGRFAEGTVDTPTSRRGARPGRTIHTGQTGSGA